MAHMQHKGPSPLVQALETVKQRVQEAFVVSAYETQQRCEAEVLRRLAELTKLNKEHNQLAPKKPIVSKGTQTCLDPLPLTLAQNTGTTEPELPERVHNFDVNAAPLRIGPNGEIERNIESDALETPQSTPTKEKYRFSYAGIPKPVYDIPTADLMRHIVEESGAGSPLILSPPSTPKNQIISLDQISPSLSLSETTSPDLSPVGSTPESSCGITGSMFTNESPGDPCPSHTSGSERTCEILSMVPTQDETKDYEKSNHSYMTVTEVLQTRANRPLALKPLRPIPRLAQILPLESLLINQPMTVPPTATLTHGPCAQCVALNMPCNRKWPSCQRCSLRLQLARDKAVSLGREDEFYVGSECCIAQTAVFEHQTPNWRIARLVAYVWGDGSNSHTAGLVNMPICLSHQTCEVHGVATDQFQHWRSVVRAYLQLVRLQLEAAERRNWALPMAY